MLLATYPAATPIVRRPRWRAAVVLAACLVAVGWSVASPAPTAARDAVAPVKSRVTASSAAADKLRAMTRLPTQAQSLISSTLAAADSRFAPRARPGGFALEGGGVAATLDPRGPSFVADRGRVSVDLVGVGRAGRLTWLAAVAPRADTRRVVYARGGGVREWYAAGPLGIEQGFTLSGRPAGRLGAVTLVLATSGARASGLKVHFLSRSGQVGLTYGALLARDARGRKLPAWLSLSGSQLLIRVADQGARYPLQIDPLFTQEGKLTGGDESGNAHFGFSVALSGDGNTAVVGGPDDGTSTGAAWVFVRQNGAWTQQGGKLTAGVNDKFGASVALSEDGTTALIGGYGNNGNGNDGGSAWVFTRSGATWSQQGPKLTATDRSGPAAFGYSVALSADGNTALIGGPSDGDGSGAAWVFVRRNGVWTQQGSKLTAGVNSYFGESVALSGDGRTAVIGAPLDNRQSGSAWVFVRSASTWSQQGSKLTGAGESGAGQFGTSVAVAGDGATVLVGADGDNAGQGAAWTFARSGSRWAQRGPKLAPSDENGSPDGGNFGASVALSNDGATALIGGPLDSTQTGAAWTFTRSGSTWAQQGAKLTGSSASGAAAFGSSVALSGDVSGALVGAQNANDGAGAAWSFASSTSPGVQCLREATAPSAPAGGVVLARPLSSTASGPNVVVIAAGASWTPAVCDASTVVGAPTTISVGAGAALVFKGPNFPDGVGPWVSSWGAVNVGPGDPPPDIDPGGPSPWRPTEVDAIGQLASLNAYESCRACDLPGVHYDDRNIFGHYGAPQSFAGDVSGANLSRAYLGVAGSPSLAWMDGWNFDDANLTDTRFDGASILEGTMDGAIVDGTRFDGAALAGMKFSALRYKVPPSFQQVSVGNYDVSGGSRCTTFANTNLLGSSFTLSQPNDPACLHQPLFPGSTVPISWVPALASQRVDLGQAQLVSNGGHALAGADLHGVDLDGASFLGTPADLEKTNFNVASLAHTSFRLADLAGATFTNATAPGAVFSGANLSGATFAGAKTSLRGANFVRSNLSGASFQSADISRAAFDEALASGTDFNSVLATGTVFSGAHIYGDGQAFDEARDLSNADFSNAVLAGTVAGGAGFDLTDVNLTGAKFDTTQCVSCNFTGSTLANVVFSKAYLPGAVFSGVQNFTGVDMTGAWLYCGDLQNSLCAQDATPGQWDWPLALGVGENYGPVPFASTNLTGVSLQDVTACPDGQPPSPPGGCAGHLLPATSNAPPIPAPCSAAGHGACPTLTSTLYHASPASPLAVTAATPATWATTVTQPGYYVAQDDGTIRVVGAGPAALLAGQAGRRCPAATSPCGDGGPASGALLGAPTGLAVGLHGSLYVADPQLHRLRRIDLPAAQACRKRSTAAGGQHAATGCSARAALAGGQISTVAGTGAPCTSTAPGACGDGGSATTAALAGPYGVWASPAGDLFIADGLRGIRELHTDGTIATVGPSPGTYDIRAVTGDGHGDLYATTHNPDYLIEIDLSSGQSTVVVGTGTSGYNSNCCDPIYGTLLPGNQVQVNDPQGLAVALNGNVVFADAGNNLIRAYVPSSGHVIDDLGGKVTNGVPQGGDNGDGLYATQTELSHPTGVAVTTGPLLIVADTGNQKVRQLGPGAANTGRRGRGQPPALARLSCTRTIRPRGATLTARCTLSTARDAEPPRRGLPRIKLLKDATVYATGRAANPRARHFALLVTPRRPISSGRYILVITRATTDAGVSRMLLIIQTQRTHARRPRRHRRKPVRFTG